MLKNTAENDTSGRCTVKWGVCGCGRVAHDFVTAMHSRSQGGRVIAVGDIPQFQENAAKFAKEKGIFRVYSSFEDVGLDPDVDVVYVAVINSLHYDVASMLLRRKKNVLVEKPCALKSAHVRDLIDLARENDCFLMEVLLCMITNPIIRGLHAVKVCVVFVIFSGVNVGGHQSTPL